MLFDCEAARIDHINYYEMVLFEKLVLWKSTLNATVLKENWLHLLLRIAINGNKNALVFIRLNISLINTKEFFLLSFIVIRNYVIKILV